MLPFRTMEYLFYLSVFIILFRFSEAGLTPLPSRASDTVSPQPPPPPVTPGSKSHDSLKRAMSECRTGSLSWMCLKMEFVKIMERLAEQEELHLMPGVSVVRDVNATTAKSVDLMVEVARSYPNDPNSRLNGYLLAKLGNFLQSHHLRFKLIDQQTMAEARSTVETGRKGKFGKKGGMEAILAAGLMMKGTLMAIGMGAIALMAGKALMTALMALTLAAVLGLKNLTGGGKSTTYEIVAKPIYTSSHTHSVSHDDGHGGHYGGGGGGGGHSGASGYGGYARSLKIELPQHLRN